MNRGVMVTRGDPGKEELILSAQGICSNKVDDPVRGRLQSYFKPLSEAYMEICRTQDRQFFGLRDFYRYYIHLHACKWHVIYSFCTSIYSIVAYKKFERGYRLNLVEIGYVFVHNYIKNKYRVPTFLCN